MRAPFAWWLVAGCLRGAPVLPPSDSDTTDLPDSATSDPGTSPLAPAVTLSYALKTFVLSWPAVADAADITVYEAVDGEESAVAVVDGAATEARLPVALFARLAATYRVEACNPAGCASSAPVASEPPLVEATGYVKPLGPIAAAEFGAAVATCADGSTIAVGEGGPAGAVTVFSRDAAGVWTQRARLEGSNADAGDAFGAAVALSADCATLAVGAPSEDGAGSGLAAPDLANELSGSGAVYLFTRGGDGEWTEAAYLKAFPSEQGAALGTQVALSGDGQVLAATAHLDDGGVPGAYLPGSVPNSDAAAGAGAVFVYRRGTSAGWEPDAYLQGTEASANDAMGDALALDEDGTWLAVGAPGDGTAGTAAGGVYLFRRGNSWSEQEFLHPPTTDALDRFGLAAALSADGSTLVVGGNDDVYVFAYDGAAWQDDQPLAATNADPQDGFGASLAVSEDGSWVAVGAPFEDGAQAGLGGDGSDDTVVGAGAAYVFSRAGAGLPYAQRTIVKAPAPGEADVAGSRLALSADGTTLVVGAPREDGDASGVSAGAGAANEEMDGAGAVYLY